MATSVRQYKRMTSINMTLTNQQVGTLRRYSEEKGLNISEMVRRAVDDYIEKVEAKEQGIAAPAHTRG